MKASIDYPMQLVIILFSPHTVALHLFAAATVCALAAPPALADCPGTFQFVDSGQRLGNLITTGIELADIDNDGDLDAITPSYLGPAAIWLNRGDGVMTEAANRIEAEFFTSHFELADFSGDGFVDLLAPNGQSSSELYLNDGTGQFELFQTFSRSASSGVAAGDLDGDGDLDAMVGSMNGSSNAPAFNDGTGHLTVSSGFNGAPANSISLGDLDGDGDLDAFLAIGTTQSFANWVLLNDGNGFFTDSGQRLGDGLSAAVQLGDFDLDGDLDALVINVPFEGHSAADMLWLNDGSGSFADSGQRLGDGHSRDLDLADFDGDGDLDALITLPNAPDIVRINDGAGRFESTVVVDPTEPKLSRSAVGDLDGDGDVDIFNAKSSVAGDRVYLNEPTGNATLLGHELVTGSLLSGELDDLCASDDAGLRTRSGFGSSLFDLHHMEMHISASTTVTSATFLDLAIESRIDQPLGLAQVQLLNHNTQQFDLVGQYALDDTDAIEIISAIDATDYVSAQGDIEISIKHIVFVPFLAFTFESRIDWVEIAVE